MNAREFADLFEKMWQWHLRPAVEKLVKDEARAVARSIVMDEMNRELGRQLRARVREAVQASLDVTVTLKGESS